MAKQKPTLYIFLDESGNFDFSIAGTKYYTITCIKLTRPFIFNEPLENLKYNLIEYGHEIESFHASEDKSAVRDRVYKIIETSKNYLEIHTIIVEKRKAHPKLQVVERFYPEMMKYLITYVLNSVEIEDFKEIILLSDKAPIAPKGKSLVKSIKGVLNNYISDQFKYRIIHHSCKSNYNLQIVDYCNYAIYKKWEKNDLSYYDLIKSQIKSEFNIFRTGKNYFY